MKGFVLLVEDDRPLGNVISRFLKENGYRVGFVQGVEKARKIIKEGGVDAVIADLRLPDGNGLELFRWIKKNYWPIPVLIISAYGTVEEAVEAVREGAYYFLSKPVDLDQLLCLTERALEHSRLGREIFRLRKILSLRYRFEGIVAKSPSMIALMEMVARVAVSNSTVLILGESGTGKELIARAIHRLNGRGNAPFVAVNCAALPAGVLESELFGHEKGAFTGAVQLRRGKFELADGGTLFLDEIGECPPDVQMRLLRVIQEHSFERVGGEKTIESDFRLVVATNRDLEALVREGKFREDLFYRLSVIPLHIPPLRERPEDIEVLAQYFLEQYGRREKKTVVGMSEPFRMALKRYPWPGNVRELEHVIERAAVLAKNEWLMTKDLPKSLRQMGEEAVVNDEEDQTMTLLLPRQWPTLDEMERLYIGEVLKSCRGNKKKAARILGVTRRTLYNKISRFGWMDFKSLAQENPSDGFLP